MKKARAVHLKGVTFLGITDSKHWVPMDGPEEFGGSDAGIRPKELLLLALAGCTGSDVASMLNKMRVPYTKFEVDIEAEMSDLAANAMLHEMTTTLVNGYFGSLRKAISGRL